MKKLNLLHLCPDLMGLYGEYANLAVLRRHLEAADVEVTITPEPCDSTPDFSHADFIYMGAGTERSQKAALSRLLPHADALRQAVARGAVVLFTGNAMETLGTSITSAKGTRFQALSLADFTTVETDRRVPEDVIAVTPLWDTPLVGFMNKCSTTTGITTPLFPSLALGFGNDAEHGAEGFVSGNLFATHITGPVLVKNPAFTDLILCRLFAAKGWELPNLLPVLPHEREAYAVTLRELQARIR
ncbi:MAG: hypothetical protein IKB09_03085 [Oscillospiraceae bacterium]|nr:hypothetical protein [Oscillospiraceae bacterium]